MSSTGDSKREQRVFTIVVKFAVRDASPEVRNSSIDLIDAHVLSSQVRCTCRRPCCRHAGWGLRRCSCARYRARTCLPRSMAACGVWSGCRGQVAPDVKTNRAVAAECAASGHRRAALCTAVGFALPPESHATRSHRVMRLDNVMHVL